MFLGLFRRLVVLLTTADSLELTSDCKSSFHLEGDCPFLPSWSPADSQIYLMDQSSLPALSGSKGGDDRSCSGNWRWKDACAGPGEAEGILV